jgi:PDZ domain-containing protein
MLNCNRPRLATICLSAGFLACIAIATARVSIANEEQNQTSPQDKSQTLEQQQTSDEPRSQEQSQQSELPVPPPPKSDRSSATDSSRTPLRYNTPGARSSWGAARNQQGASLGVNIVAGDDGRSLNVTRVRPGTTAEQMGIRAGDRIVRLNGEGVRAVDDFVNRIRQSEIGSDVSIDLLRANERLTVRGQLQPREQSPAQGDATSGSDEYHNYQQIIQGGGSNVGEPRRTEPPPTNPESADPFARDAQSGSQWNPDRGANRQTSFEDRGESNRRPAGDVESRLSRIEEQLDRISQDLAELSKAIGTPRATSGLRETANAEFNATNQPRRTPTPTRPANELQQTGRQLRTNDRWSAPLDNRFQQGDVPAARERATAEAARRRANATGAQLQQQERERAAQSRQRGQPQTAQPQTDQLPPNPVPTTVPPANQPPGAQP